MLSVTITATNIGTLHEAVAQIFGQLYSTYEDKHLDWEIILPGAGMATINKSKSILSYYVKQHLLGLRH